MKKIKNKNFFYCNFINTAIESKYENKLVDNIEKNIKQSLSSSLKINNSRELKLLIRSVKVFEDDINNQVIVLNLIERFIDDSELTKAPLFTLHKLIYGVDAREMKRTTHQVKDFPQELTVQLSELDSRFDELQKLVVSLANFKIDDIKVQSRLLAYIFSSIIRIHYFSDGNGRLARFAVQYLLKKWDSPLLPLPKVRNDEKWKIAIQKAIHGDISLLAENIRVKLQT